ncbi:MAG: hypothetical protein WCJ97_07905 [Phycisphaerae bacterium]
MENNKKLYILAGVAVVAVGTGVLLKQNAQNTEPTPKQIPDTRIDPKWRTFVLLEKLPATTALISANQAATTDTFTYDAPGRCFIQRDATGQIRNHLGGPDVNTKAEGLVVYRAPAQVRVSKAGEIWLTNPGQHELQAYSADGKLLRRWGQPGIATEQFPGCCNPVLLDFTPEGHIVVAQKAIAMIKIYSMTGELLEVVAGPEDFTDPRVGPEALSVDAQGRVYALDHGVVKVFGRKV